MNVLAPVKKFYSKYRRHTVFIVILLVLLIYVVVVLKINSLANAEPTPDQETVVTGSIPKIDGTAIKQIQSLEASNTDVHSLFEQARNNPFSE
jgi:predicted PurR-regulated permease PerM